MSDDRDRELGAVVSYLVGRRLSTSELIDAMGVSRSGYYLARETGRLITADHLIRIADRFGLNAVDLMVRFGVLRAQTAIDYVADLTVTTPAAPPPPSLGKRLKRRPDSPPL